MNFFLQRTLAFQPGYLHRFCNALFRLLFGEKLAPPVIKPQWFYRHADLAKNVCTLTPLRGVEHVALTFTLVVLRIAGKSGGEKPFDGCWSELGFWLLE